MAETKLRNKMTIYMDDTVWEKFKKLAEYEDRSRNNLIKVLVEKTYADKFKEEK